ncbi:oxaloacetate decarboxylase gamma chain [Pseudoalteromonas holothuriae]|uniref:Probable oxaloacetate decarboxylase gamma chain n=1 Tax=Pseudoalteromonas holothuriae TaxID=2963714 RepID=A0A9W4VW33_9GAMM|nr:MULTISPECIES: OadG family transporter subunit [unclassified Pseudoalteromonas]CAH9054135.1 oxaloacetate decarboxylase gamma chain [Pseudoalteromonas sp. CIP111951]CAH9059165.1 oxaloacetate decarboxylase gamma chain [Pseudoalteromonas sp. CIP111854]
MDIVSLLLEAANLMLTGMVGVFVFLSILILAVKNLARFAGPELTCDTSDRAPSKPSTGVPSDHIAAISAAIAQHRTKK